jgi:hypothetical protein
MKGSAMSLKHILLAVSLVSLSTPLLARTFECTDLDKAHWIPPETMKQKLVQQGYQVIDLKVSNSCYKAVLGTKKGQRFGGYYQPIGGYPIRRQSI